MESGEDYIIEESQPNVIAIKDVFNELDRTLGKVSKTELVHNLTIKEQFLTNSTRSILLVDYTSEMKKLLSVKDVIRVLEKLDERLVDWLDVITCFIENNQKREIMKGFLNNNSFTNELLDRNPCQYNYDMEDILRQTNPISKSINVDVNYAQFMKQSADNYQFKLDGVDVGFGDDMEPQKNITVI